MIKVRLPLLSGFAVLILQATALAAGNTPVQIEQTVDAHFPAALEFSPITTGEARVVINVDDTGRLTDLLVTSYTHEAFADEAVSVLKRWRYSPAVVNGAPTGVRLEVWFDFRAAGRITSLIAPDTGDALVRIIEPRALIIRVCRPQDLDEPVNVVKTVSPPHPGGGSGLNPRQPGSVLLDFYVDEHGQPRMPVVLNSTHAIFTQAAVDALSQWRFAAPTRRGQPVAVRVRQQFNFPGSS